MKKTFFKYRLFAFLNLILQFVCLCSFAQQIHIIPKPVAVEQRVGSFYINSKTQIFSGTTSALANTDFLKTYVKALTGINLKSIQTAAIARNGIYLLIDPAKVKHAEGYELEVSAAGVKITAADGSGLFYGLQSLIQIIHQSKAGQLSVPACKIIDYPEFSYRGMHLDVSRNMFSTATIKKWLDVLAFYKINTFHWHLTDDQGWRMEIKKYPELQRTAAWRNETLIGHKRTEPHLFDGQRYGGYYSQEDVKEIVTYAMARKITVIPEIEMPGHALAALTAYPELGCTGGPYQVATYWGVFDDVFCAGNDKTFAFIADVLDEVINLFPGKYIHIGGDECPKIRWKVCPKCQKRIKDENLKDEHELQSYFIQRVEKHVELKGRKIIGWDEILEGGISPGATVMSWRGEEGGIAAAKLKHNVIMTPEKYVYFDYYQSQNKSEQVAAGGFTPLSKVYHYNPLPAALNTEDQRYILGVQANVWSEYLPDAEKAEHMIFPRIIALAEVAWSKNERKNYRDFLNRLSSHERFLKQFNYAKSNTDITGSTNLQHLQYELKTDLPDATIRYTLDGTYPNIMSAVYNSPFAITDLVNLKAASFSKGIQKGNVFEQYFTQSLATGKTVSIKNLPTGSYAIDKQRLVNGIAGTYLYNTSEWLGFSGNNFEAVVDLGTAKQVKEIGIGILKYHWQKMWAPEKLTFEVSEDGQNYQQVYKQTEFPVEGINRFKQKINPVNARYVRIIAVNKGIIPKGEYGAGGNAWLMVDEIIVN
ncbi:glycoside hydrolase family 20 protein [Pedobacter sp. W3I1]|uniref:glycoside hydrolase family 20 protein n=1 Tax=Pedobacter sp. W3I1 TaxID=3042291 RepID=UPI0027D86299|nr:glycoside hydrolase family 20 protein [Pedobacter sp. W3I1]